MPPTNPRPEAPVRCYECKSRAFVLVGRLRGYTHRQRLAPFTLRCVDCGHYWQSTARAAATAWREFHRKLAVGNLPGTEGA
jgi:hypothetical protein